MRYSCHRSLILGILYLPNVQFSGLQECCLRRTLASQLRFLSILLPSAIASTLDCLRGDGIKSLEQVWRGLLARPHSRRS